MNHTEKKLLFSKEYEDTPDTHRYPNTETSRAAHELGEKVKLSFQEAMRGIIATGDVPRQIQQEIERNNFDVPTAEVVDQLSAIQTRLKEHGYIHEANQIQKDEALLVIHMPEPMNKPFRETNVPTSEDEEWKALYEKIILRVRAVFDEYVFDESINIQRINPGGHTTMNATPATIISGSYLRPGRYPYNFLQRQNMNKLPPTQRRWFIWLTKTLRRNGTGFAS